MPPVDPVSLNTDNFASWPHFDHDEVEAAARVLRSGKVNYWTGDEGRHFEAEFAQFTACKYAVAVANGTVALELALRALGIGPGDDVVIPSRTFIASASCVVAVGARPICADVDCDSGNISAKTIMAVLTPETRAIIAVHLAGWPCDMDPILELAKTRDLKVVEDCAQAHGANYKERPVGSLGDIAAFSFCQDKIITTAGEGGMVTTNNENLWKYMWSYKDHGKSYEKVHRQGEPTGFRWLHDSFGTNWRLSEVQSAVGRVALRKLPRWVAIRRRYASMLSERLLRLPELRVPIPAERFGHSYYRYYAYLRQDRLPSECSRDSLAKRITALGIPCFRGSCSEIYLEAAFPLRWRPGKRLPVARELGEQSLAFLIHPTLTEAHIERTCETVERVIVEAHKADTAQVLV